MLSLFNEWWVRRSHLEKVFWGLLLFGFICRLLVVPYGIFSNDFKEDIRRAEVLVEDGMSEFYSSGWTDKLPGGRLYFSWAMGSLKKGSDLSYEMLYKLPANLSDVFLTLFLFYFVSKKWGQGKGMVVALAYFFNPFVLHISAFFGQTDSVQVLLLLIILLALFKGWYGVMAGVLVFAFQFKPHSIIITPLIFMYLWQTEKTMRGLVRRVIKMFVVALGVLWILSVPFAPSSPPEAPDLSRLLAPWRLTWQQFELAEDVYSYGSVNAFNLWGFFKTSWEADNQTWLGLMYSRWGMILFSISTLFVMRLFWKKDRQPVFENYGFALGLIFLFSFTFLTRVHERYIFPVLFFYLLSVWSLKYRIRVYFVMTILAVANSWYAYTWLSGDPWLKPNGGIMSLLSLGVVIIALFEIYNLIALKRSGRKNLGTNNN